MLELPAWAFSCFARRTKTRSREENLHANNSIYEENGALFISHRDYLISIQAASSSSIMVL